MTLEDLLLARIAEDKDATLKLLVEAQRVQLTLEDPRYLGKLQPGWYTWPDVEAMCTSVLAECEAKRRILERFCEGIDCSFCDVSVCSGSWEARKALLQLLALPYADHDDYDPSWRP